MMLQRFEGDGFTLSNVTYKGQPVWLAKDVGAQLGYARGGQTFVASIRRDWGDEFEEGVDVIRVTGADAAQIHNAYQSRDSLLRSGAAVLLTETGIYQACLLTRKPAGKALRRWLARDVLPKLRRGEPVTAPPSTREARLMAREERLARQDRLKAIKMLAGLKHLDPAGRDAVVAMAIGETYQLEVDAALPVADERSYSATDLAHILMRDHFAGYRISANLVGRLAGAAGLKANREYSKVVQSKAAHSDTYVETYRYYENAIRPLVGAIELRFNNGNPLPRIQ